MGKYNVIHLVWMIRYIYLLTNTYTVDSYLCIVFLNSTLRRNGVDASITLDAAKWNCAGGEPSLCVINTIPLNTFGTNLPVDFLSFLFYVLIYMFMFLMYCDLHA